MGSIVKSIGKVFKKIGKAIKKIAPILLVAAAAYVGYGYATGWQGAGWPRITEWGKSLMSNIQSGSSLSESAITASESFPTSTMDPGMGPGGAGQAPISPTSTQLEAGVGTFPGSDIPSLSGGGVDALTQGIASDTIDTLPNRGIEGMPSGAPTTFALGSGPPVTDTGLQQRFQPWSNAPQGLIGQTQDPRLVSQVNAMDQTYPGLMDAQADTGIPMDPGMGAGGAPQAPIPQSYVQKRLEAITGVNPATNLANHNYVEDRAKVLGVEFESPVVDVTATQTVAAPPGTEEQLLPGDINPDMDGYNQIGIPPSGYTYYPPDEFSQINEGFDYQNAHGSQANMMSINDIVGYFGNKAAAAWEAYKKLWADDPLVAFYTTSQVVKMIAAYLDKSEEEAAFKASSNMGYAPGPQSQYASMPHSKKTGIWAEKSKRPNSGRNTAPVSPPRISAINGQPQGLIGSQQQRPLV